MTQRQGAATGAAGEARPPRRGVVLYRPGADGYAGSHERATHLDIARRLAALKGYEAAAEHDPARVHPGPVYLLPCDTIVGLEAAGALGVRDEHDLFGGVVPHAFVATKAITHPLAGADAAAPEGWSAEMGRRVSGVVLAGHTAFSRNDARRAGRRLLESGPVRVKRVSESGGRGQRVVHDPAGLEAALDAVDPAELSRCGLVLEEDLAEAATFSVGQVRVAGLVASYCGTQRLTPDNGGAPVYGGSALTVARGGFDALLALDLPEAMRLAVAQARAYDGAAAAVYAGFFASRRNYDVVQGVDHHGRQRSGVLEQSWRVGGASGAEIAALERFRADPALPALRAASVEVYGVGAPVPPGAAVSFRGHDDRVGFITKYTLVEPHANAR